jgi:hypothetical protein
MAKQKNAAAVALGRLGGLKGGKARARKLTPAKADSMRRTIRKGFGLLKRHRKPGQKPFAQEWAEYKEEERELEERRLR